MAQWLIKARSVSVPPALSLTECPESTFSSERRVTGPVMFAQARKETATHICLEHKALQALWHHMKDVFSKCIQQIQLFTFCFCSFLKAMGKFQENEFCGSCHGDWSAQWVDS